MAQVLLLAWALQHAASEDKKKFFKQDELEMDFKFPIARRGVFPGLKGKACIQT